MTMQLSSHNCPIEINDSLVRCGNTKTSDARSERLSCRLKVPLCVAWTVILFGRNAIGPFVNGWTLFKYCRCVVLKKCLDAPESNFALNGGAFILVVVSVEIELEATGERLRFCKISFNLSIRLQINPFVNPASPDRQSLAGRQFLLLPPILFLKLVASW